MSIKNIPAQVVKTCDACGVVMDSKTSRKEGKVTIKQHALDWNGHAVADGTVAMDLCDGCLSTVAGAVSAAISSIKKHGIGSSKEGGAR